ncbi:hypothetical protein H9P43_000617 [Blastocladiella emersonii ATCC 22665]|nr:hypothetical protein H9P43_000617 [Blastocladiella emersonii ATCC 22665]
MSAEAGLEFSVHPLVLLNISDHYNRGRVQRQDFAGLVFGALMGVQSGRHAEIFTSFEVKVTPDESRENWVLDTELFATRLNQYKTVFPEYDFLGWYSTHSQSPSARELAIHAQFMQFNELPIYARLDPTMMGGSKHLPFYVYEASIDPNSGSAVLAESPVKVVTSEPERIAVDGVAKDTSAAAGAEGAVIAHLSSQRNALDMLRLRIKALHAYVDAVRRGDAPADHALLRQIASVTHQLPSVASNEFASQFAKDYNDVLLALYLAVMTKTTHLTNDLVDRHLEEHPTAVPHAGGAGGSGGGPMDRAAGRKWAAMQRDRDRMMY